jgi:nicotinamide-nucleotide amidase
MNAEIVMIGTELLLGQIVDTNAAWMAQTLAMHGIHLYQKTTVGDNRERILAVLDAALNRADVVLTSGGLGPTEDDITRECVAELTGRPLEFRPELYEQLAARFARFRRPITDNNRKQAFAPRGAIGIENPNGTAPGLIIEDLRGIICCMPGVPHELYAMMEDSIIPHLRRAFALPGVVHYRVLKVCGIGESRVDHLIGDLITSCTNPKIGLLASPDAVKIRISAAAPDIAEADALISAVDAQVRERLPGMVLGADADTIETAVDRLLAARGWTLSTAETHTGGMMGQRFTVQRCAQYAGGLVHPLSTGSDTPEETAGALAVSVRELTKADCALAMTARVDEGLAWVRFISPDHDLQWEIAFPKFNELFQLRSVTVALEHVRRALLGITVEEG